MPSNGGLSFLQAILPADGWYIAWTKTATGSYNRVFASIDALHAHIEREDALGHAVYHACASYQNERGLWNERKNRWERRTQANAWGARSLWLDIDAGDGKAYENATSAHAACQTFAAAAKLPPPIYVGSGYGLHCYWPLDTALNPAEWTRLASGLKAACTIAGLKCDPARTTDIASVLRTPGTHNRKHDLSVEVVWSGATGPYRLDTFAHLLNLSNPMATMPVATHTYMEPTALTRAITEGNYDPTFCDYVAAACGQIALFRQTAGVIPEPLWYAAIGVTAWCSDGDEKTHEWSKGHPNYTAAETNDKLHRARQLTGATTCQKFASLNPTTCNACPHFGKIKSPIVLGRTDTVSPSYSSATSLKPPQSETAFTSPYQATSQSELFGQPLPQLNAPWKWNRHRNLVMATEKDGIASDLLICRYPIYLEGVQVGEAQNDQFSYHFKQFLPHEGWIDVVVPAKTLMSAGGIAEMFGKGAVIHDSRAFGAYVRDAVDGYNNQSQLRTRFDQFGWKDGDSAFLWGDKLYAADGVYDAVGSDEVQHRAAKMGPTKRGSLQAWSAAANALFQIGCEVQSFVLLCSFAAPLMRFHATHEGGAVVSLQSRGTAKGKSTTLGALASVWGEQEALAITNIDTRVSKGLTLGVLGNLPVVYDEIADRDPEVLREFILMFTNGRDKLRATSEGQLRHTKSSWQTLLITASNASLVDVLQSTSGVDALAYRALEMPVSLPPHIPTNKGDALLKQLDANSGHAGDAYLRYLLRPDVLAWTKAALEKWADDIRTQAELRTEHRFWVRLLSAVAVAAVLVNRLGLLEFQPTRILNWAVDHAKKSRNDTVASTQTDSAQAATALSEFLSEHVADTLVMLRGYKIGERVQVPLMKPVRRLLIRYEKENGIIMVSDRALREWLLRREISYRQFMHELEGTAVVINPRKLATLAAGTDYAGGQAPVVEINAHHPSLLGALTAIATMEEARKSPFTVIPGGKP